jgi:hypothetical protein
MIKTPKIYYAVLYNAQRSLSVFGPHTDRTYCPVVLTADKESEQSIVIVKVITIDK